MIQLIRLTLAKFQSTLPRRERLICKNPKKSSARFQSTLPRRERRMMKGMLWLGFRFQSTLPRRERQRVTAYNVTRNKISIHAPAKGATQDKLKELEASKISIHAPAKGATLHTAIIFPSLSNFNPRSREGSDNVPLDVSEMDTPFQSTLPRRERRLFSAIRSRIYIISIHAPAKGATIYVADLVVLQFLFQSTLPRRERRGCRIPSKIFTGFQSTLPRRERPVPVPDTFP